MNLIKCSAKAMSLCPDVKACCSQRHPAEFVKGSECHKFNEEVESLYTNADHIRSMSDEELADKITDYINTCPVDIFTDCKVNCKACWLKWLKQPYKENTDE